MAKIAAPFFLLWAIIAACTCGARTECESRGHVALLASIHEDAACKKLSSKGVLLYEAAKLLNEIHNNKSNTMDIELAVFDTCGSITGALKAAMKALVAADVSCLQAPYFLGLIGPDSATTAEAVHKVTSVLKIPHLVQTSSDSPYLHNLKHESDSYLVQGALKVIETLKWKSFTLVAPVDEESDDHDDVQNMVKKLTAQAISKGLCVIIHDNEEGTFSSHVVHIGQPEEGFFSGPLNATVLVVSGGDLEDNLESVNSTNTILLLEDSRDELPGLEAKVEKSKWWPAESGAGRYDAEEMAEVRWLEDAIKVYAKAADSICKKKKCKSQINPVDWNNVLSTILTAHNTEAESTSLSLDLLLKSKNSKFQEVGDVAVQKNAVKIHWAGQKSKDDEDEDEDDEEDEKEIIPKAFAKLISQGKEKKVGCATKESKAVPEEEEDTSHVVFQEMDDNEWWTMVGTVSGVGVAMFVIGILAVYIIYTNIRGPVGPKNRIERDSSLRRSGSDREPPSRTQRQSRAPQRRDSNRSVRSVISEKSV